MDFKISWDEIYKSPERNAKMNHIGTREVILKKSKQGSMFEDFKWQLIPLYNVRHQIIGTQLIECAYPADIFIFENQLDTYPLNIPINPLVKKLGYKINRSRLTGEMASVMAYVSINEDLIVDKTVNLSGMQISSIIEQQVRVVLNSVIFDPMT